MYPRRSAPSLQGSMRRPGNRFVEKPACEESRNRGKRVDPGQVYDVRPTDITQQFRDQLGRNRIWNEPLTITDMKAFREFNLPLFLHIQHRPRSVCIGREYSNLATLLSNMKAQMIQSLNRAAVHMGGVKGRHDMTDSHEFSPSSGFLFLILFQHTIQETKPIVSHVGEKVFGLQTSVSLETHFFPERGLPVKLDQIPHKPADIAMLYQIAINSMIDNFRRSTVVATDARFSISHRLQENDSKSFALARHREHIAVLIGLVQPGVGYLPQKLDLAVQTQPIRSFSKLRYVVTLAHDSEPDADALFLRLSDRFYQSVDPFVTLNCGKSTYRKNSEIIAVRSLPGGLGDI